MPHNLTPPRLVVVCLALAILTAGAIIVHARSGSRPQQPPVFRTEANFVRVDVYPMKDGKPVLGLEIDDFEVFEDGVLQKIERVEHVLIQPAGPQTARREPGSQRESLQEAANPYTRVFVIFLDTRNVSVEGSYGINEPLIRLMDRILGPDDLVGVMTPEMSASQIVLGRKTQVLEEGLRTKWAWGKRFSFERDQRERSYLACYPPTESESISGATESALAREMIRRKRERTSLEALQDVVRYLRAVREERKAVITVTEGWLLMRSNPALMNLRQDRLSGWQEPVPGPDTIGVGRTGKLTTHDERDTPDATLSKRECDTDRMRLAALDNELFMREVIDDANRANTSFYPVDPRGFAANDTPIGPADASLPPLLDQASLRTRLESMRVLALNTDGIAVLNTNDLDAGLRRISDDLTSYYLLGYYSSNAKLDGRFRSIRVRVRQPGVDVRARRGYRAATAEEVNTARRAADPPVESASTSAFEAAMGTLARIRPDARLRLNAVVAPSEFPTVWIAGEVLPPRDGTDDMSAGAAAEIEVRAAGAATSTRVTLKPGERTFLTSVKLQATAADVDVRARVTPEAGSAMTEAVLTRGAAVPQPLLFRRGPSTANRMVPAADFRFVRTERLKLELPVDASVVAGSGRLLDRNGQPLHVTVPLADRVDDSGQRWLTAELSLAALAAGDYAVEMSATRDGAELKVLTAIRVTK